MCSHGMQVSCNLKIGSLWNELDVSRACMLADEDFVESCLNVSHPLAETVEGTEKDVLRSSGTKRVLATMT